MLFPRIEGRYLCELASHSVARESGDWLGPSNVTPRMTHPPGGEVSLPGVTQAKEGQRPDTFVHRSFPVLSPCLLSREYTRMQTLRPQGKSCEPLGSNLLRLLGDK